MTGSRDRGDTRSAVTLRVLSGGNGDGPLTDRGTLAMVIATIHAIAERNGVRVTSVGHDDDSVTIIVDGAPMVATVLAAELRRVTDAWHRGKYGSPIWDAGP